MPLIIVNRPGLRDWGLGLFRAIGCPYGIVDAHVGVGARNPYLAAGGGTVHDFLPEPLRLSILHVVVLITVAYCDTKSVSLFEN